MLGSDFAGPVQNGSFQDGTRNPKTLGAFYEFANRNISLPLDFNQPDQDARSVIKRVVYNDSGAAILPGQALKYKAGYAGIRIGGLVGASDIADGFADHTLPAAGVPVGSMFLMTVIGPTGMLSDGTGTIAQGNFLVPGSTSGQVVAMGASPSGTVALSVVGRCDTQSVAATAGLMFMGYAQCRES